MGTAMLSGSAGTKATRAGRCSIPGQVYHIVSVTYERRPLFDSLTYGRIVVRALVDASSTNKARTVAFVVMPDHLHWLMQLGSSCELSEVVRWMKSRSSLALNRYRNSSDPVWQRGYFDHAVRREECLVVLSRYIVANPLRAGLVDTIGDYPLWDSMWMG